MINYSLLEIAKQQKTELGEISYHQLPRLCEALLEHGTQSTDIAAHTASFTLSGLSARYFGEVSLPMLQLQLVTTLPMVCQRCFEALPMPLEQTYVYALCDTPSEALLADDEVEWLGLDASDIHVLVEDELLMALPITVLHAAQCVEVAAQSSSKPNPFAVLQALKQRPS